MADQERIYVIDGLDYPSVTTILGATIAKQQFLTPWAIKGYHEQVTRWLEENEAWGYHHQIDAALDQLNTDALRDELMEARDTEGYKPARIGDVVHAIISQSIHAAWDGNSHLIDAVVEELGSPTNRPIGNELRMMFADKGLDMDAGPERQDVHSCLTAWQQWLNDFEVGIEGDGKRFSISDTERVVHHRENHDSDSPGRPLYAGTVDLILTDNQSSYHRRKYLIDIKTGSVNLDGMYQVAAYANAYNAISNSQHWFMNGSVEVPGIFRCFILQLRKTKGRYALKEAKNWYSLYSSGFAKANEWYISQREHTPGKQIKPADFIDGR